MSQNTFLPLSSVISQVVTTVDKVFYVIFPITRGEEITYISVKVKGAIAELSSLRSSVKGIVINRFKEHGLKYYVCTSMEDFDMKYAIYKLTDDPDSFKESYEET